MSWRDILKVEEKAHCGTEKLDDEDEKPVFEKLVGGQKEIDVAEPKGKITGEDFAELRRRKVKKSLSERDRKSIEKLTNEVLREIEKEGGALGMKNLEKLARDNPKRLREVLTKLKKEGEIFVHEDGDIYTHKPSRGRGFTA